MKYSYYKYIVVEFDDEGIQIIPRNWLINNGSATKFPPLTTNNIRYEKFCTKMVEPKDNWNTFNLKRILASCGSYFNILYANTHLLRNIIYFVNCLFI